MPWVVMERDKLWAPKMYGGAVAVKFKAGSVLNATREAAKAILDDNAGRRATQEEINHARRRP